jgi:1-deoxy-D-xylulose-5-phosphate reductoisomerase
MPHAGRRVVVLGATGSIGVQTLDVIERLTAAGHPFRVVGLSAGHNIDRLASQVERFAPRAICVADPEAAAALRGRFPDIEVLSGSEGLDSLAGLDGVDVVVNALVGAAGLAPSLTALSKGRTLTLANKESLVVGGELVTDLLETGAGALVPIDSEHSALFQCLRAGSPSEVRRLVITASGGPFLRRSIQSLARVRAEEALAHPNWTMGRRITIDSATMVNKGFEVIEAHHLFRIPYEQIEAVIHPGSVIHSLVEYHDGSVLAQLAAPDMRLAIQYALTHPNRIDTALPRLDLTAQEPLRFEPLELNRYPAFGTVLEAARAGGTAPAAVNAADEVLVRRFLAEEIPFTGIAAGLEAILSRWRDEKKGLGREMTLEELLSIDGWARSQAANLSL